MPADPGGRRGGRRRRSAALNRYPDPTNAALRRALADRYGVPADRIAVGNGSCDILLAAGEALLEPGAEIVYAWPSFSSLPAPRRAPRAPARSRCRSTPTTATTSTRCAAEITAATRLVIVCNPNNPTSTALPLDEIAAFVDRRARATSR